MFPSRVAALDLPAHERDLPGACERDIDAATGELMQGSCLSDTKHGSCGTRPAHPHPNNLLLLRTTLIPTVSPGHGVDETDCGVTCRFVAESSAQRFSAAGPPRAGFLRNLV